MHEEFKHLRVMTHNLRRKNAHRWMRRVGKAVGEALDRCIVLLQEVPSWERAHVKGYAVFSEKGKDCAIMVPNFLRSKVEAIHHDTLFSAVQIFELMFISVHFPHSSRPDEEVIDCMAAISGLVHAWKSRSKPVKQVIICGDFNVTLPAGCPPITSTHVHRRQNHCKKRVDALMDWLASFELTAVNTWRPDAMDCQQTWTWQSSRGFRSQIDYICTPGSCIAKAAVLDGWKIKSDHWPLLAHVTVPASLGRVRATQPSLKGWMPEDEMGSQEFQFASVSAAGVDEHGQTSGLCLRDFEAQVRSAATAVTYTTGRERWKAKMKLPTEVVEARK
eukprot:11055441-Karenia_brevis.AAC.1